MIHRFNQHTIEALAYYVYALVDPRDNRIFYIGKGKGNRVFQHAKDSLNEDYQSLKLGIYASVMKRYIVLLTALVISHFAMAQDFKPMEHNGLLYQELVFCNDVKGKIPLIIYLHGRHASGNDNQKQLSQTGVQEIDKYLRKNAISAYFLVPQCPEDYEWDGRNGNSGYTDKVEDLINHYLNTKDIDMNRVYICGASMGACGTWKLLKDNPKLFAAALIASGQAQHEKPTDYADTPLYVTVGSEERSYDALKWFTTEIRKAGGDVKFDVLFGQKHRNACDNAFSTKRIKWLFSQERD